MNDLKVLHSFPDCTTYRRALFVDSDRFADAVAFACANDAPLLVGDLKALIASSKEQVLATMERLERLECDVFDATTGRAWKSFKEADRLAISGEASSQLKRGRSISHGARGAEVRTTALKANQERGAATNRRKAEHRAEKLRPVVEELEASLGAGQFLTPTTLAKGLNELEIRSPRGGMNRAGFAGG